MVQKSLPVVSGYHGEDEIERSGEECSGGEGQKYSGFWTAGGGARSRERFQLFVGRCRRFSECSSAWGSSSLVLIGPCLFKNATAAEAILKNAPCSSRRTGLYKTGSVIDNVYQNLCESEMRIKQKLLY